MKAKLAIITLLAVMAFSACGSSDSTNNETQGDTSNTTTTTAQKDLSSNDTDKKTTEATTARTESTTAKKTTTAESKKQEKKTTTASKKTDKKAKSVIDTSFAGTWKVYKAHEEPFMVYLTAGHTMIRPDGSIKNSISYGYDKQKNIFYTGDDKHKVKKISDKEIVFDGGYITKLVKVSDDTGKYKITSRDKEILKILIGGTWQLENWPYRKYSFYKNGTYQRYDRDSKDGDDWKKDMIIAFSVQDSYLNADFTPDGFPKVKSYTEDVIVFADEKHTILKKISN